MANKFKPTRVRKHKARARNAHDGPAETGPVYANTLVINPGDQEARESRKEEARDALRAEKPQMSAKKKKRLDKYIDTKLRREETLSLMKQLEANVVDTSLFKSSKTLGVPEPRSHRDKAQHQRMDYDGFAPGNQNGLSSDDSESLSSWLEAPNEPQIVQSNESAELPNALGFAVGSGLKRPLNVDAQGMPMIRKKRRTNESCEELSSNESSWEGIQSAKSGTSDDSSSDASNDASTSATESDIEEQQLKFPLAGSAKHTVPAATFRARSDFKDWAQQQINEARDFQPSIASEESRLPSINQPPKSRLGLSPIKEALPRTFLPPLDSVQRTAFSVKVERSLEVQNQRLQLPVVADEQKIMEAIHDNPVVVVCGATGSGKTTQVPQFLYEAGYGNLEGPNPGMIGITQPRRVAAITMARRVGFELNNTMESSYQIRFDSTVGKQSALKFMTDGILIREIAQDFALTKYSVIIIDEAHERSVNTDILIGLLSRIVELRAKMSGRDLTAKPLKLVIMSATLMAGAMTKNPSLFRNGPPPLVESEGRQYPVTIHFTRKTQYDYMADAFRKVTKAHRRLPKGSFLVFMTAQNEIVQLSRKLKASLGAEESDLEGPKVRLGTKEAPQDPEDMEVGDDRLAVDFDLSTPAKEEPDDEEDEFGIQEADGEGLKALILPLYSHLPTSEQLRVFEPPPEGTRLIVLSTNVAETSVTIPGIRYVFDCGRAKERKFDRNTAVQRFEVGWISKASAAQRAGRAGRTGPGHCYRLYSSAVYERDFKEYTEPEILRVPAEGVVLQLKSMDLENIINFPFPTSLSLESITRAEKLLSYLGALDKGGKVTALGRNLSAYPVSPRLSKMLNIGNQHECIYLAVALVAALTTPELFIPENEVENAAREDKDEIYTQSRRREDTETEDRRKRYNKAHHFFSNQDKHSDALRTLSAFCAYAWAKENEDVEQFCANMFLRPKAMSEAFQLYRQLLDLVALNDPGSVYPKRTTIPVPTIKQKGALKQMVAAAFLDQVAMRADLTPTPPDIPGKPKRAIDVPYITLFPSYEGRAETSEELAVFIHPSSVLRHASPKDLPQYLVYSSLQRAASKIADDSPTPKTRMHPLTAVSATQLSALARNTPLLEYSKPIGRVEAVEGERKRLAWVVPSLVGGPGGRSWPLPALKVLQRRAKGGDWEVERVQN